MDPLTTAAATAATKNAIDAIAPGLTNAIWRTVKYPFKVGANVRALQSAIIDLKRRRNDVRTRVETGERQGGQVRDEVAGWMERVGTIENNVREIERKYESRGRCLGGLSFNCWSKYTISKNAAKLLLEVNNTRDEGVGPNYQEPTMQAPPPVVQEVPIGTTSTPTAISNLELARQHINNDPVGVIGIWGMGGVGKTHLLENINNSYEGDASFDVVVLVTASKDCSIGKIQSRIVEKLGLVIKDPNENQQDIIFNFLNGLNFLLLLDDLWEWIDLKKVGVPRFDLGLKNKYKRKVVLTTQSLDVCGDMEVREMINVVCLNDNESFSLFRDKVGNQTLDSHPLIPSLAQKVVNELGGLPLALITMGRAMYEKRDPAEWDDAIYQLQESSSNEIKRVYHPLIFSYENLPSEMLKKCFMFCSLLPYPLVRNELIKSWIGLGYIEEPDIKKAYTRGRVIIGELLRRCLLEEYHDPNLKILDGLKMHDVIRDMAHWIACDFGKDKNKWVMKTGLTRMPIDEELRNAEYISFMNNNFSVESCSLLSSPSNLTTLLLPKNRLNIFPINMSHLTNLKYLNLASNNISVIPLEISNLTNLLYLNLSVNPIHSIPTELKALINLKFLYLTHCIIGSLPEGVILALKSLEVLDLLEGIDPSIVGNSSFVEELKSLKNLKALGIPIQSSELEKFDRLPINSLNVILVGNPVSNSLSFNSLFSMETKRYLVELCISRQIKGDDASPEIEGGELEDNFPLIIEGGPFPNLEKLDLNFKFFLRDIVWRGVLPEDVFPRLTELMIGSCYVLEHITWIAQLLCLQKLTVDKCATIKELIRSDEKSNSTSEKQPLQTFLSLKSINLLDLEKLESICDPDHYTFPSLRYLSIIGCPRIKKLPFPNDNIPPTVKYIHTDGSLELACHYINNEDVGVIGICGMGGVGKTHLLKKINDSYKGDASFNIVVLVSASKNYSTSKIQARIAEKLGLVTDPNERKQANIIFNFLRETNFLLLLDDLWEEIDLLEVGLPFPLGLTNKYKRKVVLTTRSQEVCGKMMVRRVIQLSLLNEFESWALLQEKAGHESLDPHLPI